MSVCFLLLALLLIRIWVLVQPQISWISFWAQPSIIADTKCVVGILKVSTFAPPWVYESYSYQNTTSLLSVNKPHKPVSACRHVWLWELVSSLQSLWSVKPSVYCPQLSVTKVIIIWNILTTNLTDFNIWTNQSQMICSTGTVSLHVFMCLICRNLLLLLLLLLLELLHKSSVLYCEMKFKSCWNWGVCSSMLTPLHVCW